MSNTNITITIEQAIGAAQAEIEAMTFRVGDPNYPHAQAAHELIRTIRGWYAQAQAKAGDGTSSAAAAASSPEGEDGAETEPGCERTERECEA